MYAVKGLASSYQNLTHILTIHMQNTDSGSTFNLVIPFTVTTSKEDILNFIRIKLGCSIEDIKISKHVNFATVGILL